SASPRISHSSAGFPSCNAARYLAISSVVEPWAIAADAIATAISASSARNPITQSPLRGHAITASSVRLSPWLSTHVTMILSPFASLRCPVSISWLMSTLTSVESPTLLARIFIGSAMSSPAAAQSDLDFLGRDIGLAVGLDQRVDLRGLRHLDAGRERRLGSR